jgi:hypothetical protein
LKRFLLCYLLLLAISLPAQYYRPFLAGRLHYFTSASNYSVRIDSVGEINGDSAYWMNAIAVPPSAACLASNRTHFVMDQEGLFGDHFIHLSNGAYAFVNRSGDTATFHTQLPNAVSWTFLSDSNLTASISLRGQVSVAGVLDSMLVIDISDGRQYRLTQHYGFYLGPNLSYYLRGDTLRFSTLAELPEVPDFKDFFAWQPGDVYNTLTKLPQAWDKYDRWEILQRIESANGDSLTLVARHRHSEYWHPSPHWIDPPDTITMLQVRHRNLFLEKATYEADTTPGGYHWQQSWSYNGEYANRKTLHFYYFDGGGDLDSCGYSYASAAGPCLDPVPEDITMDLGPTFFQQVEGSTITTCIYSTFTMVCHELAGQDSLGPCPAEIIILPQTAQLSLQPSIRLWQRSHTGEVGIRWEDVQPGIYRWQVFDLGGKVVWEQKVPMSARGSQALDFRGSNGMYVLYVSNPKSNWMGRVKLPWIAN